MEQVMGTLKQYIGGVTIWRNKNNQQKLLWLKGYIETSEQWIIDFLNYSNKWWILQI